MTPHRIHPPVSRTTVSLLFRPMHTALLVLASAGFALMSAAHAAGPYTVGQRLSQTQVQALGTLDSVTLDGRTYQVLQTGRSSLGQDFTLLLSPQRAVGQTHHELLIANQPTDQVRQQLGAALAPAASVKYYDHTGITVARFATLTQAVDALARVRTLLPGVEAGVPVRFSTPTPR